MRLGEHAFWLSCDKVHLCKTLHASRYSSLPLRAIETTPLRSFSLANMTGLARLNIPLEVVKGDTLGVARPALMDTMIRKTNDFLVVTTNS